MGTGMGELVNMFNERVEYEVKLHLHLLKLKVAQEALRELKQKGVYLSTCEGLHVTVDFFIDCVHTFDDVADRQYHVFKGGYHVSATVEGVSILAVMNKDQFESLKGEFEYRDN